jgi:protein-S-isoprenylcysteine O-methyltransferase Ste14
VHRFWRFLIVLAGSSGLRIDRLIYKKTGPLWFGLWIAFFAVNYCITREAFMKWVGFSNFRDFALLYVLSMWVLYYFGNAFILGTDFRFYWIEKYGEDQAYRVYEMIAGLLFLHQGMCQSALLLSFGNTLPNTIPLWVSSFGGLAMIAFGTGIKLWATFLTGLDMYYYKDMFLGTESVRKKVDPEEVYVVRGPYRWFKNPMYGPGYIAGYGFALYVRSFEGLVCALIFHATIYSFYFLFERKFVARTYLVPLKEMNR